MNKFQTRTFNRRSAIRALSSVRAAVCALRDASSTRTFATACGPADVCGHRSMQQVPRSPALRSTNPRGRTSGECPPACGQRVGLVTRATAQQIDPGRVSQSSAVPHSPDPRASAPLQNIFLLGSDSGVRSRLFPVRCSRCPPPRQSRTHQAARRCDANALDAARCAHHVPLPPKSGCSWSHAKPPPVPGRHRDRELPMCLLLASGGRHAPRDAARWKRAALAEQRSWCRVRSGAMRAAAAKVALSRSGSSRRAG